MKEISTFKYSDNQEMFRTQSFKNVLRPEENVNLYPSKRAEDLTFVCLCNCNLKISTQKYKHKPLQKHFILVHCKENIVRNGIEFWSFLKVRRRKEMRDC